MHIHMESVNLTSCSCSPETAKLIIGRYLKVSFRETFLGTLVENLTCLRGGVVRMHKALSSYYDSECLGESCELKAMLYYL